MLPDIGLDSVPTLCCSSKGKVMPAREGLHLVHLLDPGELRRHPAFVLSSEL